WDLLAIDGRPCQPLSRQIERLLNPVELQCIIAMRPPAAAEMQWLPLHFGGRIASGPPFATAAELLRKRLDLYSPPSPSARLFSSAARRRSTNFTERIEISYSRSVGMARPIWLTTSGGASIAATVKMMTTA